MAPTELFDSNMLFNISRNRVFFTDCNLKRCIPFIPKHLRTVSNLLYMFFILTVSSITKLNQSRVSNKPVLFKVFSYYVKYFIIVINLQGSSGMF